METDTDIGKVYQKVCFKHKIPVNESILSCFNNGCVHYGELNLSNTKITETSFLCITDTLRQARTIRILNLSNCLFSFNGLKKFLDVLNELDNLSQLNLKGNRIENNVTAYISQILLNNTNITELQLNWNNIGNSVETFAKLCNSLMSNTVLNTLNLANNNLCQNCSFHFAKMLRINKCLKNIDLSWNYIGESGALLLLESLKNNDNVLELNIQCNSVSLETSSMIAKQLEQNQLNKLNQNNVQNKNMNILNNQHKNQIDTLKLELCQFQKENKQLKQELDEMKNNNSNNEANNSVIVDKLKSELLHEKQRLRLFVEKISDDLPHSDVENMNSLEDLEKITYIIKRIKKNEADKCLEETQVNKTLLDTLPILTDGLNIVKEELKTIKNVIEIEINNLLEELTSIQKKFSSSIFYLQLSNGNDNQNIQKMFSQLVLKQQDEMNTSVEQAKMLLLLNSSLKTLYHEKIDLEIKVAKEKTESVVSFQTKQVLENSLKLAKDEIKKLKNEQVSNKVTEDKNTKFYTYKFDKLLNTLFEKEGQLQMCKMEKQKIITSHLAEISTLKNQLETEKQKFEEQKKQDQKKIEDLCKMLPQYFKKLLKKDGPEDEKFFE